MYPYHKDNAEEYFDGLIEIHNKMRALKPKYVVKGDLVVPPTGEERALDKILESVSLPPIEYMVNKLNEGNQELNKALEDLQITEETVAKLQEEMANLLVKTKVSYEDVVIESDGTIPEGTMSTVKASEVFPEIKLKQDFDLPFFTWDGVHPDVPKQDEHYIFREKELTRVLYAIITNKRAYLQGHTGSGKTTLIEQIAARLSFPFVRVNFDSEITRMDFIGRDTLDVDDGGQTISTFVEGILPKAMAQPCFFCADEIDFVRPDVAYVLQAALEGNSLRITEDGDRVVKPHPMFRMFATGNTVGQGDEEGMYQGARPQSMALLDRFTVWLRVDYLNKEQREDLVMRHNPSLDSKTLKVLSQYIDEHLEAFTGGKILQPITPRGS
jgi:cobaltochelatase CobS